MAAPSKKNNNVSSISAATGGSIQRGNTETKKIEIKDNVNRVQAQPDAAPPAPTPVSKVAPTVSDLTRQIEKLTAEQPDVLTPEEQEIADEDALRALHLAAGTRENPEASAFKNEESLRKAIGTNQEEDEVLTEQEKKDRGFAKASPNFEEVDKAKAAAASPEEQAASLEENKIDEVKVEGDSTPDA